LVRRGDYAPTVAALVLFGEYPPRFLPQCAINAIHFRGHDLSGSMIVDRQLIQGTAPEMIEQAVDFVRRNMRVGGVIQGIYRQDFPEYPEEAVREAVINAVIHRDWSIQQKILLKMFDDRLEIENAGGLPGGVTLELLLQNPRPYPRNPLIVDTLYEFWRRTGFVEQAGSGLPRIRRVLRELGAGEPVFWADPMSFRVTLPAMKLGEPDSEE
jgi:ATP-dependent DNA helicase RecG